MALKAGDKAPDFALPSHRGGTVRLSDFRGRRHVVVAFHPLAFTPVCANQMTGYQADLPNLESAGAAVLGVSTDPQPSKTAWANSLGLLSFDLLSDFHPKGDVARKFGVYREKEGFSERAVFVVDKEGTVIWSKVYDIPEQPDNGEIFEALAGQRRRSEVEG
jgi:peroxiredoxin